MKGTNLHVYSKTPEYAKIIPLRQRASAMMRTHAKLVQVRAIW